MTDPAYLVGQLEEALTREGETDLHVQVAAGRVLVTGTVVTDERRDAVTAIATRLAGDLDVHNRVTVLHCHEPDGEEHLS